MKTRNNEKVLNALKIIALVLMGFAVIFAIGTAGAYDNNDISRGQYYVQALISLASGGASVAIYKIFFEDEEK